MTSVTGDPQWWRSAVVYQVWPRSFADGDGDGFGDLRGVVDRLDHLADLGVDALWLSPIYPSPMVDGGYDVADYCAVHPELGTMQDVDDLVAAAHDRGIRVILDLVVNHTSDEHPWFVESRSPESDKRSWYFWRPPRPGHVGGLPGAEPNNWESHFGGSAWEWDAATGEYYLHVYAVAQPDLDWSNPDVRSAVHDVVRFWLDRGVDGFRMDVITKIDKHAALPDGPLLPGSVFADGSAWYLDGPKVHGYLAELRREVLDRHDPRPVTIGEAWAVPVDTARSYTDPAAGELDLVLAFDHVLVDRGATMYDVRPLDVRALTATLARWQTGLGGVGWSGLYWGNHDQPRMVSRFGDPERYRRESSTMLLTVLFCLQGTAFLFQGEEIGMADPARWSEEELRDVSALNHLRAGRADGRTVPGLLTEISAAGRDNARTPMRWDGSAHHGFSPVTPWIRSSDDPDEVTVAAQRDVPDSLLDHVRRLIAFRRSEPVLRDGLFAEVDTGHPTVWAYTRGSGADQVLVVGQWASEPAVAALPDAGRWQGAALLLGNYGRTEAPVGDASVDLAPWEVLVLRAPADAVTTA